MGKRWLIGQLKISGNDAKENAVDYRKHVGVMVSRLCVGAACFGTFVIMLIDSLMKPPVERSIAFISFLLGMMAYSAIYITCSFFRLDSLLDGLCEQSRKAGWDECEKKLTEGSPPT